MTQQNNNIITSRLPTLNPSDPILAQAARARKEYMEKLRAKEKKEQPSSPQQQTDKDKKNNKKKNKS